MVINIEIPRELIDKLSNVLDAHQNVKLNLIRQNLIKESLKNKEAILTQHGALATWRPTTSTGRSPKDTVIVLRKQFGDSIDWDAPNNIPIDEKTFNLAWNEALAVLPLKEKIYVTDRVVGADSTYALPVRTVTDQALTALFTDNMFRQIPEDLSRSIFATKAFTLLVLPLNKLNSTKFKGMLRTLPNDQTSDMLVAMDFERRLGVIYGSSYCGSVKKLMFTVMNYYLPEEQILPLHCSANESFDGEVALLLGLSGTGKTTLSADSNRLLIGDDEHGWGHHGVANFEAGCYAKLIDLDPEKEPELFQACFGDRPYLQNGVIIENAMVYPDGSYDLSDDRFTPNSRGSYPLSFLSNIKSSSTGGHPKTILFLTADAYGVLPPISKLTPPQAMLWFLMGYTSKLAGTETGIVTPKPNFSRFFGAPFMPRIPKDYSSLLGKKIEEHNVNIYLVNTGWSGGSYGIGKRMDIKLTRKLVEAALSGELEDAEYIPDPIFKVHIPKECSGVSTNVLFPKHAWGDKDAFDDRAKLLADEFRKHFETSYLGKVALEIEKECPGL